MIALTMAVIITPIVAATKGNGYKKFVIRRSFQSCGHEYLREQIVYTQR